MDNTDHLHPNWKALATANIKWKVFVQAQPEAPHKQKEEKKDKFYTSLGGEDAKKFYEALVEDYSQPTSSVDHEQFETEHFERAPALDNNSCHDLKEIDNQKGCSGKKENIHSIHKAMKLAQNNDAVNLRKMLGDGLNVNAKDDYGWSLLMVAACAGARDAVQLLLEHKARTGARDSKGNTAIYLATMKGHGKIVDMLIKSSKSKDRNSLIANPSDFKGESQTEEFFCGICQKVIKKSTKLQHETSIVHQFKLGMGKSKTMYGIPPSNKGYQLLVNQGWDTEKGLGPQSSGTKFPVKTVLKRDREGLGHTTKDTARITHFGPADTDAVKRLCKPNKRIERQTTLSRRERRKQKTKEQRKEIEIRRMLNEPDY